MLKSEVESLQVVWHAALNKTPTSQSANQITRLLSSVVETMFFKLTSIGLKKQSEECISTFI